MCDHCLEVVVDEAIAEGRIEAGKRDTYLRALEDSPRDTAEFLASLDPDSARASANRREVDPEGVALENRDIAARFGLRVEQVI